ncbi:MAG TPA: ABC transporter ATP-binding protein [Lachnospiraceae bacterium]|nr:ABC transporter ATP-binding protein [Lachnospiraceae bacterium]
MRMIKVKKRIGNFQLSIEDFTIEKRRIHGIIGANGCGKSTLLKLLSGILDVDSGGIDYGGLTSRDITITTQRPYLINDSVYENLIYPLKIRKRSIPKSEIDDWLEKFGLAGKEKQFARSLSSGERQKLSFARALIFKPKVVLIDETMANLDLDSVALLSQTIENIQEKEPITWVIVSHQLAHIYNMCEQVHFMADGSILAGGTREEIFSRNDNPIIRRYLSSYMIGNESG